MKKRRICWIILFILSLVAISYYGGAISYGLFYVMILIPVISFIYLLYVYTHFRVYQEIQTRNIIAEESVPYCFILRNEHYTVYTSVQIGVYADFSMVEEVPDNREFCLFPGEKITFDTKLTCKYRGEYNVGVKNIIISDFLGLFKMKYAMPSTIQALVMPRIVKLDTLGGIPEIDIYMQSMHAREKDEPDLTVRDYVQGDALKKIHWKSTAISGKLKVKNDIGVLKRKIVILADFDKASEDMNVYLPLENKILELIIALLYYFIFQNTSVDIFWNGTGIQKRQVMEVNGFEAIYEELSRLYFLPDKPFTGLCAEGEATGLFSESSIIFMVTHIMEEGLFEIISALVAKGKSVVVYVITREDISGYVRQSSMRMKIVAVSPEDELEEILS